MRQVEVHYLEEPRVAVCFISRESSSGSRFLGHSVTCSKRIEVFPTAICAFAPGNAYRDRPVSEFLRNPCLKNGG